MKNIELKVKLENFDKVLRSLRNRANFAEDLFQKDTYFNSEHGRLKLRNINNETYQLIYYERPNKSESKISSYEIIEFNQDTAEKWERILALTAGVKVEVVKNRQLWIYRNTRIHLDNVHDLGKFIELETVIKDEDKKYDFREEHKDIIKLLQLNNLEKINCSYCDLLKDKKNKLFPSSFSRTLKLKESR